MKKIICYGDSNTFGYNPKNSSRFDENTRWTSILQNILGLEYEVLNEGMCDRTGFVNNPNGFLFSGQKHFSKFITESENVDILILWIGTNDLQFQYNISIKTIEEGLENLIKLALPKTKKIIIIPPVLLSNKILEGYFKCKFDENSIAISKKITGIYRKIADLYHCEYLDINKFTSPADFDGLHYDENSHKIIANILASFIKDHN